MKQLANNGLLAITTALFIAAKAEGKFGPLSLSNLGGGADLIVIGVINEVRAETIGVDVLQNVAGAIESAPLEVRKFADWTCGRRWAPYEVGQCVLLFLSHGAPHDPKIWRIMGAGGEGDFAYPRVPTNSKLDEKRSDVYYTDKPQPVSLDQLCSAIRDNRHCFKYVSSSELHTPCGVRQICANEEVEKLRLRSDLHAFLFEETTMLARMLVARWESERREGRAALERDDYVAAARHARWAVIYVESIDNSDIRYLETLQESAVLLRRMGHSPDAEEIELRISTLANQSHESQP